MFKRAMFKRAMFKRAMSKRRVIAGLVALGLVASCTGSAGTEGEKLEIIVTTSILGDITRQVVGEEASVAVLIPSGADPHDYRPSARDVEALTTADVVIANGLGLEEGLEDVFAAASADGANILSVAEFADPVRYQAIAAGSEGGWDPHIWFDPLRMVGVVEAIAAELARIDPSVDWQQRAAAFSTALGDVHQTIETTVSVLAPDARLLVTNHEFLGYFARRYGFDLVGVVVPGGSSLSAPSSSDLAALVAAIDASGAPAIFIEQSDSPALAESVAAEAAHEVVVVPIFGGSLGDPGTGADSYLGMLETNAMSIVAALS